MSGVVILLDTTPVQHLLDQLVGKLEDMTPVMAAIGEIIVEQTDTAFETGTAPGGAPWKPSSRVVAEGGQTLVDTGHLKNSITRLVSTDAVTVGTGVVYGAIHQLGGVIRPKRGKALAFGGVVRKSVTMPSRPFLPDDQSVDWSEITATLEDYLL